MKSLTKQFDNVDQTLLELIVSREKLADPVELMRVSMDIDEVLDRRIALMQQRDGRSGLTPADNPAGRQGAYPK